MTKKELMKVLDDPDMRKLAKQALDSGDESVLEDLTKAIELADDESLESLSQKHAKRLGDVVKYFSKKLKDVEDSAVEKATQPSRDKQAREIDEFTKTHEHMKNDDVIEVMKPFYNKGLPLDECYEKACKALDLDSSPTVETDEDDNDEKGKKAPPKKTAKRTSKKTSTTEEEPDGDVSKGEGGDKPKSLSDVISENSNALLAKSEFSDIFEE